MSLPARRPRVLPMTIGALALAFCVKSAELFAAVAAPAAADTTATPPSGGPVAEGGAKPAGAEGKAPGAGPNAAPPKAASGATAEPPPVTEAERTLLLDLRHRREELDARSRALDARQTALDAADAKLRTRLDELTALQSKLEQLDAARHAEAQANWTGLVKMYEAMKPREAAAIFDQLDQRVLLPVLDRMNERRAAAVLAAMTPEHARAATQMLAELRMRQTTPPGTAPLSPAKF